MPLAPVVGGGVLNNVDLKQKVTTNVEHAIDRINGIAPQYISEEVCFTLFRNAKKFVLDLCTRGISFCLVKLFVLLKYFLFMFSHKSSQLVLNLAKQEENGIDPPQSMQRGVAELVDAALTPRNLCMMDPTWHPWF